jgi:hypothetical protein
MLNSVSHVGNLKFHRSITVIIEMLLYRGCSSKLFRWLLICLSLLTGLVAGLPTNAPLELQDESELVKRAATVSLYYMARESAIILKLHHFTTSPALFRAILPGP